MIFGTIVRGALLSVCLAAPVHAQPSPSPSPEPSPSPSPAALRVGGFVDAYYAYNGTHPFDHTSFYYQTGASSLILKLEGRYDKSSSDVFIAEDSGLDGPDDGPSLRMDSQFLLILGVVASLPLLLMRP